MANVFFFTSNASSNWNKTIEKPVEPARLRAFLRPDEITMIEARSMKSFLAWGAQTNTVLRRMSVGDVIFGARQGEIHFGAEVIFILDRAVPDLSQELWGRPDWPFIYFMGGTIFRPRASGDFLLDMGEHVRAVWGFRRSIRASEKLARYSSKRDFISQALTSRPP